MRVTRLPDITKSCNGNDGTYARLSEIEREFYGADARWDNNILSNGLNINLLNWNETNISTNFDQYFQAKLGNTEKLDLHTGVCDAKVRLKVEDKLLRLNTDISCYTFLV